MSEQQEQIKKIADMIKGIHIAMMTTIDEHGSLRSRPMGTQKVEFDGDLWFFTDKSSTKVKEVEKHREVNISYSKPDDNTYVSVSGKGKLVTDRKKIEELWDPSMKAWFPKGLEDPDIALIQVEVHDAEYWDSPSSKMVLFAKMIKGAVTGEGYQPSPNEHDKVSI